MSREVQREVERADAGNGPDREPPGDPDPALGCRHEIQRDRLAYHPLGFLGSEPEGQRCAIDLDECVADRFARLEGHEPPDLLAPLLDAVADRAQRGAALIGR